MEKEPIMPIIRKMEVGETYGWDKTRTLTVRTVKNQIETQLGVKFTTRKTEDKILVTRVK